MGKRNISKRRANILRKKINFLGKCISIISNIYGVYLALTAFLAWFMKTDIFRMILGSLRTVFRFVEFIYNSFIMLLFD